MKDTGFWLPPGRAAELPGHYSFDSVTGALTEHTYSSPEIWSAPPVFPSGSGGLVSTADDYLAFARMLLNGGVHGGTRLLSSRSVAAMTTNHLTPAQIGAAACCSAAAAGATAWRSPSRRDEVSGPGRYGWSGGYGTTGSTTRAPGVVVIVLSQVSDLLWNGALTEFGRLAYGGPRMWGCEGLDGGRPGGPDDQSRRGDGMGRTTIARPGSPTIPQRHRGPVRRGRGLFHRAVRQALAGPRRRSSTKWLPAPRRRPAPPTFEWHPLIVTEDLAIIEATTTYPERRLQQPVGARLDNLGQARQFTEWWMQHPDPSNDPPTLT